MRVETGHPTGAAPHLGCLSPGPYQLSEAGSSSQGPLGRTLICPESCAPCHMELHKLPGMPASRHRGWHVTFPMALQVLRDPIRWEPALFRTVSASMLSFCLLLPAVSWGRFKGFVPSQEQLQLLLCVFYPFHGVSVY